MSVNFSDFLEYIHLPNFFALTCVNKKGHFLKASGLQASPDSYLGEKHSQQTEGKTDQRSLHTWSSPCGHNRSHSNHRRSLRHRTVAVDAQHLWDCSVCAKRNR